MSDDLKAKRLTHLNLLTENELAELLDVKPHTLATWRADGKGPDFTKLGKQIFYRKSDVEDWIQANVVVTRRTA